MSKLNKLFEQRAGIDADRYRAVESVDEKIYAELSTGWDDWRALTDAMDRLDSSTEYGSDEGGIYRWVRFDLSGIAERERPYFDDYMIDKDGAVRVDYENDALMVSDGPGLIINDEGDVLDEDSGKWIISRRDYKSEEQRAHMIEEWMQASGYFPGVFEMDRYGNVTLVNVQKLAANYKPEIDEEVES
jgi:hypothetical protein